MMYEELWDEKFVASTPEMRSQLWYVNNKYRTIKTVPGSMGSSLEMFVLEAKSCLPRINKISLSKDYSLEFLYCKNYSYDIRLDDRIGIIFGIPIYLIEGVKNVLIFETENESYSFNLTFEQEIK